MAAKCPSFNHPAGAPSDPEASTITTAGRSRCRVRMAFQVRSRAATTGADNIGSASAGRDSWSRSGVVAYEPVAQKCGAAGIALFRAENLLVGFAS
jgi:hypothetical protein